MAKEKKSAKERKAREPRTDTLHHLLWTRFEKNQAGEVIVEAVARELPASKFNKNPRLHFNYYRGKYNQEEGHPKTTSALKPVERKRKEPKAKKAKAKKAAEERTQAEPEQQLQESGV